jgi:hypothetical protein
MFPTTVVGAVVYRFSADQMKIGNDCRLGLAARGNIPAQLEQDTLVLIIHVLISLLSARHPG